MAELLISPLLILVTSSSLLHFCGMQMWIMRLQMVQSMITNSQRVSVGSYRWKGYWTLAVSTINIKCMLSVQLSFSFQHSWAMCLPRQMHYLGYTKCKKIKITHNLDFWFLQSLKRKICLDQLAGTPIGQASSVPNTAFNDLIAVSYLTREYVFLYPVIRNRRI